MFKMDKCLFILLFVSFLKLCVSLEQVWHSYQYDPIHQSREELVITNIIPDDQFKLDYVVEKWKSINLEKICFLAGITKRSVVIAPVKVNSTKDGFSQKSYIIDLEANPIDFELFQYWNASSQNSDVMVVIATQKSELLWYRIDEENKSLFWTWPCLKNISHINIFRMNYDYQLLIISEHSSKITADWYEVELKDHPNFWLRQKLELEDFASSSAVITSGPDYFLAIPQKSFGSLLIYKLNDNHFLPYKNLTSRGINNVISFKVGHKSFLAFNGFNAGIYHVTSKGLIKKNIAESHLDGVNYWLPIPLSVYDDDTILIAQRSLSHGGHKSFVIEIITHNGDKFQEHDDIPCSYFGEEVLGLSCLPEEGTQTGIKGSISIFLNGILGLLVPRKSRPSELFLVKTKLKKITNPMEKQIEEFSKSKQHINNLIQSQEDKYNQIVGQSQEILDFPKIKSLLDELEKDINDINNKIGSIDSSHHYDKVIFNGLVKIKTTGIFDEVQVEKINGDLSKELLEDIVLRNKIGDIPSLKTFAKLEVDDLIFETVNDIDSNNLLFSTDNITVEGNLFLAQPLTVFQNITTDEVNGLPFDKEVIDVKSSVDNLVFENLDILGNATVKNINNHRVPRGVNDPELNSENFEFDRLFIPMNIEVDLVNGYNFNKFLKELCLKNIRNVISGTIRVNGDVTVEESAETDYLNNLKFPLEYVFMDNSFPNITGVKKFTNLTTTEVNCEGTIDDVNTSQIITLSTRQNISGTTTFKNLKITESLNVDGSILGEHASRFLPNPTLLETNFITAKVNFKSLEVDGVIILSENLNGKHFATTLSDIIYINDDKPVIEAMKQFPEGFTVRTNLMIDSNSINNIPLDSIVTKNTDQLLNLTELNGVVTFANVDIEGLYDSVDVKKLDEELVKLDGEQFISSTLIFEDEINVSRLEILESIRDLNQELFENENNKSIEVEHVIVEGNIYGKIDGFDLEKFEFNRMSYTKDQVIEVDFNIEAMSAENMISRRINEIKANEFSKDATRQKLITRLINGELSVTNFHAKRSLEVEQVNNKSAMNLGGSFWEHNFKKNNITKLTFKDDIYLESVSIERLSGVDFNKYVKNIIFKNETDVRFSGRKIFLNGFTVKKLIETQKLNYVHLSNILTRHGQQEILGPLAIEGDVLFVNNVTVFEDINHVPIKMLTDVYQVVDDRFEIKGDILFNRLPHIHSLNIQGYVDDRMAQEVIDGIIYTDGDFKLRGQTIFENNVNIEKNIRVTGKINNIDLPAFVSDVVLITKDTTIEGPVRFTQPVLVEDQITIHNSLKTHKLNGIDPKSWTEKAIFINKGFLRGRYMFEDVRVVDTLQTDYINDINITTLIPLRSQQNLTELTFDEVTLFKHVSVGNSTNFYNLPDEFDNSVLINSDQYIDSDVEFLGNVFIEGDMDLSGTLNQIKTNRIVTTNTDQELTAIYNFKSKVNLEENLVVEGLVNGIDVQNWSRQAIRTSTQYPQNVTDNWSIDQDLIFEENSTGNGLINGINFQQFSEEIQQKRNYKYQIEKGFIDDYANICKDLIYMYDKLKRQIYKFNYFESIQDLNFQNDIDYVFHYEYENNNFLLINEKKNCDSYLFIFEQRFRYVKNIHFGQIAQIILVHHDNKMYFVVRNQPLYSMCKVQGTDLWQLIDNDFVHLAKIEDQDLLQESLVPGTFYGISGHVVTEFKILADLDSTLRKYRKWEVKEENLAFVPRGFATGLALRTGRKLIRLNRDDPITDDFSYETEEIIRANYTEEFNTYFPGHKRGDLVVMKVGIKSSKKNLLAVTSPEETSVKGSLDFIKIYEDVITGKLFHKVSTYKPSSLVSLEFNNGETLLAFLENESVLQVYEYKGIEGFKHKFSAKLEGSKLFTITLKVGRLGRRKIMGVVDKNKISLMEAVMLGNQVEKNLHCNL